MNWAIALPFALPAPARRRYFQLQLRAARADPANRGQRFLSFVQFERLARTAAGLRRGPSGNLRL